MARRVQYEMQLRDRKTGIEIGWKKGKIRIRENETVSQVVEKIAKRHMIDTTEIDTETRLKNYQFKKTNNEDQPTD